MAQAISKRTANGSERDLEAPAYEYEKELDKVRFRQIANPAPLGLCGFALTTFVLSLVNVGADGVLVPNIVIGLGKSLWTHLTKPLGTVALRNLQLVCGNLCVGIPLEPLRSRLTADSGLVLPRFSSRHSILEMTRPMSMTQHSLAMPLVTISFVSLEEMQLT
jgi:hypothetical protein